MASENSAGLALATLCLCPALSPLIILLQLCCSPFYSNMPNPILTLGSLHLLSPLLDRFHVTCSQGLSSEHFNHHYSEAFPEHSVLIDLHCSHIPCAPFLL